MTHQPHTCALLTLRPHDGDGWPDVVAPILRWLAQSEPGLLPVHRMQLLIESHSLDVVEGDVAITIAHLTDSAGIFTEWALRYRAPDQAFAPRLWQTDIGLMRDVPHWHVSVIRTYGLTPGYIGPDAPLPTLAPPPIIAPLLASKYWSVVATGDFTPMATPHLLHAGSASRLVAALTDLKRSIPLVYISQTPHGGPICDQNLLARALAGAAVTVVAAAPTLDHELAMLLPPWLQCFGGAVRVYLPEVQLDNQYDAQRHRYLPPTDLALMSSNTIVQTIARGVLNWNLAAVGTHHLTVDDVQFHALQQRLHALRVAAERDGNDLRAYVALLEQENSRLATQVRSLTTQVQQMTTEYAHLEAKTDREVGRLARELVRPRVDGSEGVVLPDYEPVVIDALQELPQDLPAMLDTISQLFPSRLRVTERARKSARAAGSNRPRELREAWRILYALATKMYELVFAESAAGDLPRRFTDLTGIKCALTEGRQTKSDERMMAMRRDIDDQGNEIDITPHVKLGHKSAYMLRVHFAIDHHRRLLIIGHCGDHLDTFGTHRIA